MEVEQISNNNFLKVIGFNRFFLNFIETMHKDKLL